MTTETEKSPREIARLFLEKWHIYASPLDAIELLIKARDERAAKILETAAMLASPVGVIPAGDPEHERLARMAEVLTKAASAIRGTNK